MTSKILVGDEIRELASMALVAMDSSESVQLPLDYLQGHKDGLDWAAQLAESNHPQTGDWLYDDPIELAKAIRKGPYMPPVQPVADSEPVAYIDKQWTLVYYVPPMSMGLKIGDKLYRHAQPAPVVPEEKPIPNTLSMYAVDAVAAIAEVKGWNACRAAMLQELKKSAGTEAICRSNENVQAVEVQSLTSINPAPDLVSLQKKAESIIGNYPGIPDCWCCTCRPVVLNDMRFVVCPDCGNKRCPRANDHRNACTGSNEPGQEGSAYPDTPQEVKGE
ncbi:hypothetical protein LNP44_09385 [Klebsiella pneumoniae subsp. pneumoniae]|nr:hypothetical protein [Klebsiella pneumoniae subsp. pneumoniae]